MNDFTKEELESFFLALTEIEKDPFFMRKIPIIPACWWEDKLINKLKSMIDNYCEHESTGDGAGLQQICRECGKEV